MKCEIVNGCLVVEPGTPTERYAFEQWLELKGWRHTSDAVRVYEHIDTGMPHYPPVVQPVEG